MSRALAWSAVARRAARLSRRRRSRPARTASLTAPVNDFAHVIDAASARSSIGGSARCRRRRGDVVVVATVQTFQPYGDIDEYAVKMFENGGAGDRPGAARTTAC